MDENARKLIFQQCYVDGAWIGEGKDPVLNPATGAEFARVPDVGAEGARAAIEAANWAFPGWAAMLAKERGAILRRWFDLINENAESLAQIMTAEQGKPLAEARGEVAYGASFVEFNAEQAKRILGEVIPSHRKDGRIVVLKQPIGVVGAITPWNFPLAMITRKVSPALAAGCTIVVKPAEDTPLTALALAELAHRAGFPKGVLNIITGDPPAIGKELTESPLVRMIAFTGSTEVGKILMRQAASTVKKVALELGGNSPFIVFDDADLDKAVDDAIASKFRNMGQTCVCANRILVQDAIYDAFAEKLAVKVSEMKVGPGDQDGVVQGPLINEAGLEKVEQHVADAIAKGGTVLTGGKRHALGKTFFEPTVITGATTEMLFAQEETFGPVAPLYRFRTEEEAIAIANSTPYGLAAYFQSRDIGRIWRVAEHLDFGVIGINEGVMATELAPFGGMKQSGLGREGSHHGIEEFVEMKYLFMGGIAS
ncbi:MAG TPA: NAD-dependent succinate-semialdehyde dehydrogenase [Hyphomicrobiales bacterium]|nr:NAD-dependent succinate-semialdehyde dehydrogenase [Hyphomicrobiales bacterium]